MNQEEKSRLYAKYGHSRFLLSIHLLGKYIKDIYHSAKSYSHKNFIICGENNQVPYVPTGCGIRIYGDGNKIEIDPSVKVWNGDINIGDLDVLVNNCTVHIGKNCTSNGCNIVLFEDNSRVDIGDGCMFSWGINIWASDSHAVFDEQTKEILNWGTSVEIKEHVWIGMHATVLKNSYIAKNCIVGAHSVVTKKFEEPGCILAGNPGRVVRRGINWDSVRPKNYINCSDKPKVK